MSVCQEKPLSSTSEQLANSEEKNEENIAQSNNTSCGSTNDEQINVSSDSIVLPNESTSIINEEVPLSPNELYRKLEIIKEIKIKTVSLQKLKSKLSQEVESIQNETKCMTDFKTELDLLIQEKLAHLEELRQIQEDINLMENTIKQADEEKRRAFESARRLQNEYKPLKDHINELRESIGLNRTDENDDVLVIEQFLGKLQPFTNSTDKASKSHSSSTPHSSTSKHHVERKKSNEEFKTKTPTQSISLNNGAGQPMDLALATVALMAQTIQKSQAQANSSFMSANSNQIQQASIVLQPALNLQTQPQNMQQIAQQRSMELNNPSFRQQQPPPMKTCLSCHQQIHRNAPICPLCKAKSRSRNPKKPKKKNEMDSSSRSPSSRN
jgi:hypothetical protein